MNFIDMISRRAHFPKKFFPISESTLQNFDMIFMNFPLKIIFLVTSYESTSCLSFSISNTTKHECLYLEIKEIIFESNFVSYVSVRKNRIGFEKNRVSSVT